ncbi:MAG: hypothetical protein HQ521_00630 [Bacteroidetes bacterium]|nr:hypothetical protein [Bacteroidota bacterium]
MDTNESTISPRKKRLRKKGGIYLLVFIICLAAAIIMHSAGIDGGIIFALISLAWLVFLIIAIITLIRGYSGK